jgi:hypothetical protein
MLGIDLLSTDSREIPMREDAAPWQLPLKANLHDTPRKL